MKKKIKVAKLKKGAFYQGWGTYTNETVVAVNMTHDEITTWLKHNEARKGIISEWEKGKEENEKLLYKEFSGMVWMDDTTGATVLWMKEWKNEWKCFEVFVHELRHLVDGVFRSSKMLDEPEACAYQTEFLFREIRKKLQKFS